MKGKWKIVSMAIWDKEFLDMIEPAYITFDGEDAGQIAFGCVTGSLTCSFTSEDADFTWEGNNEMDPASGDGWAELQPDGSIEGEISFQNGDESTFIARPW